MTVFIDVYNLFGCQGVEGCNFGAEIDAARELCSCQTSR